MTTATKPPYDPAPLSSLSFWEQPADEREKVFSELRRERPISWHPPFEGALMPNDGDPGYWAVVRHADVVAVSRNPAVFCSGRGVMLENVPEQVLEAATSFLATDAPRHTQLRRLIQSAFTPRQVARIEEQVKNQARQIVDDFVAGPTEVDFVEAVSNRLPLWTISEMMGVPPDQRDAMVHSADGMVSWNDPEVQAGRQALEVLFDSLIALLGIARGMAEARRSDPTDDLMTALVQAEVEGERLTDEEIGAFFVLLAVAGNDTTRNTISHGMRALSVNPDQRAWLMDDFETRVPSAVEEMLRWGTAVMTFRRTATCDTELGGQQIAEGDKVVMFYGAANWDDTVFPDPHRFDLGRQPNDHVAFGGGGPHYCMGASLARSQLRAILNELLHKVGPIEFGEPELLVGNFIHAIKKMPCRFKPA